MLFIMKNLNMSSDKFFGYFFSIVFVIFAFYFKTYFFIATIFAIFAVVFFFLTIINSKILGIFNNAWKEFGIFLGKLISPIILFFIYFFVVFTTKIVLKIFQKDILSMSFNKNAKSYWNKKTDLSQNMDKQY